MWKNIQINANQVETETGRACLIKMPNGSDFAGYMFWHPAKCVREGKHSAALSIGYTEDWNFKLIKKGNGKYNKFETISEQEISVEDFEEAFNVTNDNIREKKEESYLIVEEPEAKEIKEVEVKESLKNE